MLMLMPTLWVTECGVPVPLALQGWEAFWHSPEMSPSCDPERPPPQKAQEGKCRVLGRMGVHVRVHVCTVRQS